MTQPHRHRHHGSGNANIGRIIVAVAGVAVLAANAFAFSKAASLGNDAGKLKIVLIVGTLWMICGAIGVCYRSQPGRILVLMLLYIGCLGYFIGGIMVVANSEGTIADPVQFCTVGAIIYLVASLVLTRSRNVLRLTIRAWE